MIGFYDLSPLWWHTYAYFPCHTRPASPIRRAGDMLLSGAPLFSSVIAYYMQIHRVSPHALAQALECDEEDLEEIIANIERPEHFRDCIEITKFLHIPPMFRDTVLVRNGLIVEGGAFEMPSQAQAEAFVARSTALTLEEDIQLRLFLKNGGRLSMRLDHEPFDGDALHLFSLAHLTTRSLIYPTWFGQLVEEREGRPAPEFDFRVGIAMVESWLDQLQHLAEGALWGRRDQIIYIMHAFCTLVTETWRDDGDKEHTIRVDAATALQYQTRAIELAKSLNNTWLLIDALITRATIFHEQKNHHRLKRDIASALDYMQIEQSVFGKCGSSGHNAVERIKRLAERSNRQLQKSLLVFFERARVLAEGSLSEREEMLECVPFPFEKIEYGAFRQTTARARKQSAAALKWDTFPAEREDVSSNEDSNADESTDW